MEPVEQIQQAQDYNELLFMFLGWFFSQLKDIIIFFKEKIKRNFDRKEEKQSFRDHLKEAVAEGLQISKILKQIREKFDAKNVNFLIYHNGLQDNRGVGFKNFSVRYEEPRELADSFIMEYQMKPLTPYYDLIAEFENEKIQIFSKDTDNDVSILTKATIMTYNLKYLVVIGIYYESRIYGVINILIDRDSDVSEEDMQIFLTGKKMDLEAVLANSKYTLDIK